MPHPPLQLMLPPRLPLLLALLVRLSGEAPLLGGNRNTHLTALGTAAAAADLPVLAAA
jgi:hypothetical protein